MLHNLVKKFKTHSLNEREDVLSNETSLDGGGRGGDDVSSSIFWRNNRIVTRNSVSKMLNNNEESSKKIIQSNIVNSYSKPTPSSSDLEDQNKDSGTESDEELELIETNSTKSVPISQTSDYYASQQSLSASCRSSHCGSPGLTAFSDHESSNSWDASVADGDCPVLLELPNHPYHTRQQFQRFVQREKISSEPDTTAFAPVRRLRSDPETRLRKVLPDDDDDRRGEPPDVGGEDETTKNRRGGSSSLNNCCSAAEKRKWSRTTGGDCCYLVESSGIKICSDNQVDVDVRQNGGSGPAAARKTPVTLLIPPAAAGEPTKKLCRRNDEAAGRPCLNFEKMREKMVKSSATKKKNGQSLKLRDVSVGYQLRSSGNECLFQPVPAVDVNIARSTGFSNETTVGGGID